MKLTLLEMVQDILSDGDSDEVNSLADTVEAMQVARIVRTAYNEIIDSRTYWAHLSKLIELTAAGAAATPTQFTMADNIQYMEWIKYNKKASGAKETWEDVKYLKPKDFLDLVHSRVSTNSNVQTVNTGIGGEILILNDEQPTYWTTFDDETIIMDSFDNTVDSTLQGSKTQASAYVDGTWTFSDTFTPDLPSKNFSYLLAEAKSVYFNSILQEPNSKEEQRSRRQRTVSARNHRRSNKGIRTPDYGRKSARKQYSTNSDTSAPAEGRPWYLP